MPTNCLKCVAQMQSELSDVGRGLCDCLLQICGCQIARAEICLHNSDAFVCVVQTVVEFIDLLRSASVNATDLRLQLFEVLLEGGHAAQDVALAVLDNVHGCFQAVYCWEPRQENLLWVHLR